MTRAEWTQRVARLRTRDAVRLAGVVAALLTDSPNDVRRALLATSLDMHPDALDAAHEELVRVGLASIRWLQ